MVRETLVLGSMSKAANSCSRYPGPAQTVTRPSGQDVQSRQLLGQLHGAVQREQDGGAEADRLRLTGQAGEGRNRLEGLVGMGDVVMPDAEVLVSKGLGFAGPAENIGDTAA